uniref:Ionotropic glutamate receptor C-terminal domain-containing protein n=1 Tax=Trichobilharzia regenti TaxID=157069 RepID=A0AA85K1N2_TRIRE|nr:unnamed protein product [Trichobilharzia regenti]
MNSEKHHVFTVSSVLFCCLVFTGISLVNSQTVFIPNFPEYIQGVSLVNLLSVNNSNNIKFTVKIFPNDTTVSLTDIDYCKRLVSKSDEALCLFQYSYDTLLSIRNDSFANNNKRMSYLTRPFTQQRPVLLAKSIKKVNSSIRKDSWFMNAVYFLYAFHSSIWSLILLYALTTGSLLFVFEYTRPTSDKYTAISPSNDEPRLNLLDSYLYTFRALFLQSYNKLPKSWGGMTITLFWHAFCLICIIAYIMGTSELIFKQYTDDIIKAKPYTQTDKTNQTVYCNLNDRLCQYFERKFQYPIIKWSNAQRTPEISNESVILLTDHIHAHYLQTLKSDKENWELITLKCNTTENDDSNNIGDKQFNDMPIMEMGFLTFSEKSLYQMNIYLKGIPRSL